MTRKGKCDTCRSRKVKCDEVHPKCGACTKLKRPCTWSHGKAKPIKFVVEDPRQYTSYGRPQVEPVIYPADDAEEFVDRGDSFSQEAAGDDSQSSLYEALQRRSRSYSGSRGLHGAAFRSPSPQPFSANESRLAIRMIQAYAPHDIASSPFVGELLWINSLPSRLGKSPALDSALEFMLDSYCLRKNETLENLHRARRSKNKSLQLLRAEVDQNKEPNMSIVLAIKIQIYAEIFHNESTSNGVFLHVDALNDMLRPAYESMTQDPDFWQVIFNTYEDEVNSGFFTNRRSKFDTPFYLAATNPHITNPMYLQTKDKFFHMNLALMHLWIQQARFCCLVRDARASKALPDIAAAIALGEYLWGCWPSTKMDEYLAENTIRLPQPPSPDISDVVPDSLHFSSVQAVEHLQRGWLVQGLMCGLTMSLYKYFPSQATASLLPPLEEVQEIDLESARQEARSMPYCMTVGGEGVKATLIGFCSLLGFLTSALPWLRLIDRLREIQDQAGENSVEYFAASDRILSTRNMINWIMETTGIVNKVWGHDSVMSLESMIYSEKISTGGPIPKDIKQWARVRRNNKRSKLRL